MSLKLHFRSGLSIFQIIPTYFKKVPLFIIIDAFYQEIYFEFERKKQQTLVFLLSYFPQVIQMSY